MPTITKLEDVPTLEQLYDVLDELPDPKHEPLYAHRQELNDKICIWRGDITTLDVDMIVNAANESLLGGGGVDGAIHRAAGRGLLAACRELGGCETGQTKVTRGYDLPARHVAHTVGPVFRRADADECHALLHSCYETCLRACVDNACATIAFPAVSTGIYGFPIEPATTIAVETTRRFLEGHASVEKVVFVVFNDRDEAVYERVAQIFFPPSLEQVAASSRSAMAEQPEQPEPAEEA
ncbi:hypothetical protein Q5752_000416 [Cryptotrichosporon argae]